MAAFASSIAAAIADSEMAAAPFGQARSAGESTADVMTGVVAFAFTHARSTIPAWPRRFRS